MITSFWRQKCTWLTPPSLFTLAFLNEMEYRKADTRVNSVDDLATSCENVVNFGPVIPEFMGLNCVQ